MADEYDLQKEALRYRIANLLQSPPVTRINFRCGAYSVRGGDYVKIATALVQGRLKVAIEPERLKEWQADAAYVSGYFVFNRPTYGNTVSERRALVHEATHAVAHLHGIYYGSTFADDEAAAYIAGALYCLYIDGFSVRLAAELSGEDFERYVDTKKLVGEPFHTALIVARLIQYVADAVVPSEEAAALKLKIAQDPAYLGSLGRLPGAGRRNRIPSHRLRPISRA